MATRKIIPIGEKLPSIPVLDSIVKPTAKNPDDIPEIVAGCLESVATTEDFLQMLKQVGSYAYRKNIHLSDVELSKLLDDNITAQLSATRDYYLIWEFIHRDPKIAAKWEAFWKECDAEIQRVIAGGGE